MAGSTVCVRDKVKFYEKLFSHEEEIPIKRRTRTKSFRVESFERKEEEQENKENTSNVQPITVNTKLLGTKEKIHRKKKPIEREVSSYSYREKPVTYVKEEREKRVKKIEHLEKKVKTVKNQHRDSLKMGDTQKAESLLKHLHRIELKLARENEAIASSTCIANEKESSILSSNIDDEIDEIQQEDDIESSDEIDDENEISEDIHVDTSLLSGDLWGGIVDVMANKYCIDAETTWRTFSSYSVTDNDSKSSELFLEESDETSIEDEESTHLTEKKNRCIFEMYDKLENDLKQSNQQLEDAKTELAGYRARLYSALHELAQNEYQVRIRENQLIHLQTEQLEMEQKIENQAILLAESRKKQLENEIKLLRENTEIRKQQVDELRKQIRTSISALPQTEQTELRNQLIVEDPFIECSVRLLDNEQTTIQRISIVETKLSTLSSSKDVRIVKTTTTTKRKSKLII